MSDPVEVLLNSPRSTKAMQQLGFSKEDLRYLSKEELKAKIGNMKITKVELAQKWDDYEQERKDKIARILEERKKIVAQNRTMMNSTALSGQSSLNRSSKHSKSLALLPNMGLTQSKNEIAAMKQRKEYEMTMIMKKEIEGHSMKKLTQQKYEMLLQKEREQLEIQKLKMIKKKDEMKRLHNIIAQERSYQIDEEQKQEKQTKIHIEKQLDQKKLDEQRKRREYEKQKELELRMKEQQFKVKTQMIIEEQQDRIEKKREELDNFIVHKHNYIQEKEVQKEQNILKRKEDNLKGIYRTLEKNAYLTEKKKQDWLDKALEYEEKQKQKLMKEHFDHQKKLEDIKKKEFYRDAVKQRNNELIEEKKNKTLWKLEKIELKSPGKQRGSVSAARSEDRDGQGQFGH